MLSASGRGRPRSKGQAYIPSYMDLSNGPEPCVVCGDAATGFHYRCMTCEGCKGFFRRTIQKNLKYSCKDSNQCAIDKSTRNQCQQCRFRKCVEVGMATDLVLNENQRVAKRQLIEDNRERRKIETIRARIKATDSTERVTEDERQLINSITDAYCNTFDTLLRLVPNCADVPPETAFQDMIAPYIRKIISFAKLIPGFPQLEEQDQITLLRTCWLELTLLRIVRAYDSQNGRLCFPSGKFVRRHECESNAVYGNMLLPLFDFAVSWTRLGPDETETALIATVLLLHSGRPGLSYHGEVQRMQETILTALKHYLTDSYPDETTRWPKILMRLTDLRAIGAQQYDKIASRENAVLLIDMFGAPS